MVRPHWQVKRPDLRLCLGGFDSPSQSAASSAALPVCLHRRAQPLRLERTRASVTPVISSGVIAGVLAYCARVSTDGMTTRGCFDWKYSTPYGLTWDQSQILSAPRPCFDEIQTELLLPSSIIYNASIQMVTIILGKSPYTEWIFSFIVSSGAGSSA